ncbi:hypothetical protein QVZ41_14350 [Wenyingzhuangia sp. chi5]|uniref:Uncharacterized protein n=1 Tax=Wenyingzhuangia gilva TaxID=3057677 RepID=A0ABT8VVP2_9FLAO|nr:hypothetical protein [Wenyingzhuangia sp. chi5]MDO3696030.1 hypothetical protein [Wenyingzhuangia sp. chi5]
MIISQSCNNNDCGECFTPPEIFSFKIVDKTSGENLFTNGTYEAEQIEIINTLDNSKVNYTFISENNINIIQIEDIGWKTETVNIQVNISNVHIFDFYVNAERKKGECCSYTEYNNITIEGSEYELENKIGIYKIMKE